MYCSDKNNANTQYKPCMCIDCVASCLVTFNVSLSNLLLLGFEVNTTTTEDCKNLFVVTVQRANIYIYAIN